MSEKSESPTIHGAMSIITVEEEVANMKIPTLYIPDLTFMAELKQLSSTSLGKKDVRSGITHVLIRYKRLSSLHQQMLEAWDAHLEALAAYKKQKFQSHFHLAMLDGEHLRLVREFEYAQELAGMVILEFHVLGKDFRREQGLQGAAFPGLSQEDYENFGDLD